MTESRLRKDSLAANENHRQGEFHELLALCELDEQPNSHSLIKFASPAKSNELKASSPVRSNDSIKIPSPASYTEPIKITARASSSDVIKKTLAGELN